MLGAGAPTGLGVDDAEELLERARFNSAVDCRREPRIFRSRTAPDLDGADDLADRQPRKEQQ